MIDCGSVRTIGLRGLKRSGSAPKGHGSGCSLIMPRVLQAQRHPGAAAGTNHLLPLQNKYRTQGDGPDSWGQESDGPILGLLEIARERHKRSKVTLWRGSHGGKRE
jgi:hypothetical protein